MLVEGKARTAVFTDDAAPEIDSAQYETGIGPCLDSFRHQAVFTHRLTRPPTIAGRRSAKAAA